MKLAANPASYSHRAPAREKARSQKAPNTGKRTARPAGKPVSSSVLVRLRRSLLHPLPCRESKPEALSMRFLRYAESISPMWGKNPSLGRRNDLPSVYSNPSPRTRREDRILRIVQMSSGRIFLDRVARQHCPSLLHRHGQIITGFFMETRNRTFLLCAE